jgi:hypothetical protein
VSGVHGETLLPRPQTATLLRSTQKYNYSEQVTRNRGTPWGWGLHVDSGAR